MVDRSLLTGRPPSRPMSTLPARRQVAPMPVLRPRRSIPLSVVAPRKDEPKNRSLWEQFSDAVTGIPAGLKHLGGMAITQATAPFRIGRDLMSGKLPASDLPGVLGTTIMPWQAEEWGGGQGREYFPLTQELGTSMGQTALRIRHPSRYRDAVREGRIVDTVLEDAGNVALAGAALAKGAGLASRGAAAVGSDAAASALTRVGAGAERVAGALNRVADAPIELPAKGLRYVVKDVPGLIGRGVDAAAERPRLGENSYVQAAKAGVDELRAARERSVGRAQATKAQLAAQRRGALVRQELFDLVDRVGLTDAEQGAVIAMLNQVGDVDALAASRIMDALPNANKAVVNETVRQSHTLRDIPEHSYSPDAQAVVQAYKNGTLDAAARERIDTGMRVLRERMAKVTSEALDGSGRIKGGLDPAQLGNDAIDQYVYNALTDAGWSADLVQQVADMRAMGMSWEELGTYDTTLRDILRTPEVYPARWRPAMRAAALTNDHPLARLGATPAELMAQGIESPTYLPGGEARLPNPRTVGVGQEMARAGFPGLQGLASENMRVSSEVAPYSFRALADKLSREVTVSEMNRSVMEWVDGTSDRVNTVLDDSLLSEMRKRADAEAAAQRGTPRQIKDRAQLIFAGDVVDALEQAGYEILPGDLVDPKTGDFNPAAKVDMTTLNDDMVVLPVGMKQALIQSWVPKDLNRVLRAMEKGNTIWKRNVLPFSIRWQLGDMTGGMYMAWIGGGVKPWEMIDAWQALRNMDDATRSQWIENAVRHPDFIDVGTEAQQLGWQRGEYVGNPFQGEGRNAVSRGYNKLRSVSYKINGAINKMNRQGYLLAKVQDLLDQQGLSLDQLGGDAQAWADPKVQAAINDAVIDANKVMGTFDELTPFERRVVRNAIPFWVWQRHITQLAWRTAIDNPARMLWTLRLGSYGSQHQDELPPFMRGSIQVGGALLPMQWANPFNDVAEGSLIQQPGKSLSPVLKLGAAALGGFNLNTMQPYTRPYGSGNAGSGGREGWTPMLWPFTEGGFRPAELGYVAGQMFPLSRAAMNLSPTMEIGGVGFGNHPRYQQGTFMVDKNGNPIDNTSRAAAAAGIIGLPWPTYSMEDARNILGTQAARNRVRGFRVKKVTTGLGG